MDKTINQIIQKLNTITAHQDVLEYLALAIFDEMQNKIEIIAKFTATTYLAQKKNISEARPKTFLSAFRQFRKTILEVLTHEIKRTKD
jgi:hypothetical protein